jgi:hypothetical protein
MVGDVSAVIGVKRVSPLRAVVDDVAPAPAGTDVDGRAVTAVNALVDGLLATDAAVEADRTGPSGGGASPAGASLAATVVVVLPPVIWSWIPRRSVCAALCVPG